MNVRTIEAAEIEPWIASMSTGFLHHAAEGEAAYRVENMDMERTWGAFDGTTTVGTQRSFATPCTVPGPEVVTAAALTNVTVAATHRRRGVLTEMITADLRASAERGEPLGILIASEYPIYGRFGYGPAIDGASYTIAADTVRFRHPGVGEVDLVDPATLRAEAPAVYERVRMSQPGAIGRKDRWWDEATGQVEVPGSTRTPGYQALYRAPDGAVDGYLRYTASSDWDQMRPKGTLTVTELVATTPAAYARLWRYCCEVDLITRVAAGDRPVDEPLAWLLADGRALRQTGRYDFIWVRILDVAASLAARRYGVEGRLVLEVVDPQGITGGRFALEGGPDGATCTATDDTAELTMPVDAVGALSMGGVSAVVLGRVGRVDEHRAGALADADRMFRTALAPWCSTWF